MDEELQFSWHVDSCGLETVGTNEKKTMGQGGQGVQKMGLVFADCNMFCYFFAPGDRAGFAQSGKIHQQD